MLRICGDVVLPKVTLNPIDSHKPMYCKVTITGIYYPLDIKVNNDHHGDLLSLGNLSKQRPSRGSTTLGHLKCPSRGATTPWARSNIGDLLPPEDIIVS